MVGLFLCFVMVCCVSWNMADAVCLAIRFSHSAGEPNERREADQDHCRASA
jgi:hypothetical protein